MLAARTPDKNNPCQHQNAALWLQELLRFRSVTPDQAGALDYVSTKLEELGFLCERFESQGVSNLVACYHFGEGPVFAFSGHIDVVPADTKGWRADPFCAAVIDGAIYGRGAADMKGGVAAMLSATQALIQGGGDLTGTFYWLITSDEEGEAEHGSKLIAAHLAKQGVSLDACLVGEPTADARVGDVIKNGRRGAISGRIRLRGKAGHVAYPEYTINAVHQGAKVVTALSQLPFCQDEEGSKTSLQVTGVTVPGIVDNLVPGECEITFNIRYSHGYHSEDIRRLIEDELIGLDVTYALAWERPCEPYYTGQGEGFDFISLIEKAVFQQTGHYPTLSTSGGTSDGRFFAEYGTQVVECGVRNHTIHQVNEHVPLQDLEAIGNIYSAILQQVFCVGGEAK